MFAAGAGSIEVTPAQMRSTSQAVQGQISDWQVAVSRIYLLVDQMDQMWDGLGNDSFNQVFRADRVKFDRLHSVMDEYQKAITAAAETYEKGEQEVVQIVKRGK